MRCDLPDWVEELQINYDNLKHAYNGVVAKVLKLDDDVTFKDKIIESLRSSNCELAKAIKCPDGWCDEIRADARIKEKEFILSELVLVSTDLDNEPGNPYQVPVDRIQLLIDKIEDERRCQFEDSECGGSEVEPKPMVYGSSTREIMRQGLDNLRKRSK